MRLRSQHGTVLFGLAGGMLVIAVGLVGGYYVAGSRSEARAATTPAAKPPRDDGSAPRPMAASKSLQNLLANEIDVVAAGTTNRMTWAQLGIEIDPDEAGRGDTADVSKLAARGRIPVRLDRDKAQKLLLELKPKVDKAPLNAYLDLEARKILDDTPGQGLDVWGSLPRLLAAARTGAPKVELAMIPVPAAVTKAGLGIDDISHVMGHYTTRFPVGDRDRNFNLKLAASKLNGVVLKPGVEWSFNDTVGERSEKEGYKIAHVITAGEMVDGLAGGTCQISTTLFGAVFYAGIDIVKTTNHSRPSAYTPLGFDATVVWPNTDLKLKNPYDFPVVIRYVVANGEATVEVLGKPRPYDKIVFERHITEREPFSSEERLDEEIAKDETNIDQEGFDGIKLTRFRKFFKDGKLVKQNKWDVVYKPVTEYIRRGTSDAPDAKHAEQKDLHSLKAPTNDDFTMSQ